jgi:hypothetical protein
MAKELSDLFNANRLRVLWNQSGQAGSGAAPTHNSPEPAVTKKPPADSSSDQSGDPIEYLRKQASRSHIAVRGPDDVMRALGYKLSELLRDDSLTLLPIWQPLQIEVAKLISSQTRPFNTTSTLSKSSPDQLYKLINQLDDAVTALLANESR